MIRILKRFILNKYFLLWQILFLIIIYFICKPLCGLKASYMDVHDISDYTYIYYTMLLPMTFFDSSFIFCLLIECSYLAILSYVIIQFIDHFFIKNPSSTFCRIGRHKWIKEIIKINLFFALIISLIYIIFCYFVCINENLKINFEYMMLIPIAYKILLTILIPNIYLLFYIKTDEALNSTIIYILCYIILEIIIKSTFYENTLTFTNPIIIILLLLIIYISIIYLIIKSFEKRDLG